MPQDLSEDIRECYRHAEECRREAEGAPDPITKAEFLEMERRWRFLARTYEFSEHLSQFTEPTKNLKTNVGAGKRA